MTHSSVLSALLGAAAVGTCPRSHLRWFRRSARWRDSSVRRAVPLNAGFTYWESFVFSGPGYLDGSITITADVYAKDTDDGRLSAPWFAKVRPALPTTGGSVGWLLMVGMALVLSGIAVVTLAAAVRSERRVRPQTTHIETLT